MVGGPPDGHVVAHAGRGQARLGGGGDGAEQQRPVQRLHAVERALRPRVDAGEPADDARLGVGERRDGRARPQRRRGAVGVGDEDHVGLGRLDGGVERVRLAAERPVLRDGDEAHARRRGGLVGALGRHGDRRLGVFERGDARAHDGRRPVRRAVVGDDDLEPAGRVVLREQRVQAAPDCVLLVAGRDDDGDEGQRVVGETRRGSRRPRRPPRERADERGVATDGEHERGDDHEAAGRAGKRHPAAARRGSASRRASAARAAGGPSWSTTTPPGRASRTIRRARASGETCGR